MPADLAQLGHTSRSDVPQLVSPLKSLLEQRGVSYHLECMNSGSSSGVNNMASCCSRARTLDSYIRPQDSPGSDAGLDGQQARSALAATRRRGSERGVVRCEIIPKVA